MLQTPKPTSEVTPVKVHYLKPEDVSDAALLKRLQGWLDDDERARLQRFVRPVDQQRFLVSHGLLRLILSKRLDCLPKQIRFGTTGRHKPVVIEPRQQPALHFNLSHTQAMVVVAVSASPVGVDVEWLARPIAGESLAARYFTLREFSDIQSQDSAHVQQQFMTYWTLKEAFLKAEGWGIVDRLDGFEFEISPKAHWPASNIRLRVRHALSFPTRPWRFYQWHVAPDHLISLAVCARQAAATEPDIRPWDPAQWD